MLAMEMVGESYIILTSIIQKYNYDSFMGHLVTWSINLVVNWSMK